MHRGYADWQAVLQASRKDVLLLYAAICAHKVFTAMSLSTRFMRLGISPVLLTVLMLPFHLLPPLAVILAAAVGSDSPMASLIMISLATGTFLYVGAFEVLCEEFAEHDDHTSGRLDEKMRQEKLAAVQEGQMRTSEIEVKADGEGQEWHPSKVVKFAMFTFGMGMLLVITAALPKHSH